MSSLSHATPTWSEVLRLAIDNRLMDTFVAIPCTVEKYYPEDCSAELRPGFQRVLRHPDGERVLEKLPNLPKVPVMFPRGNGFFIQFALSPGDTVLTVICDRDVGNWVSSGTDVPPDDRVHALGGAVCFPVSFSSESPGPFSHLAMGSAVGKQIHIKADSVNLGSENPSDFVVLATKLLAAFNAHTHPFVASGAVSPTSAPTAPLELSDVASNIVKSE